MFFAKEELENKDTSRLFSQINVFSSSIKDDMSQVA
jgi:hypothetical protein